MADIYLSSTFSDLKTCRDAVYHALRQMQHNVIAMEDYVAKDQRPLDRCLADVVKCDLYVGLFAWRYGYVPTEDNPDGKSITELEYRAASKSGKHCLIFILAEDAHWPATAMDAVTGENDRGERISSLRSELTQTKNVSFFKTPEHLASLVVPAVHLWESTQSVRETSNPSIFVQDELAKQEERKARLRAMLADHRGFMKDRLASFVGREREMGDLRHSIAEKLRTGGYVTITGQAGQGKSSIIAKLIEEYGSENVAFHFIPFRPGPDHQVSILRNLMARLILKYDLSDLYVASESRAALRDYFPKVLEEVVIKGGQEVIFIDGLDQLEEELNGRDLSFLPDNPPHNVTFVLGTRPNDTLRPLELLKPRFEYQLPNLSRTDFDLILQHRSVQLSQELADRFYEVMQKNALYLDLVAKELAETGLENPVEVIERVADDPDNIFTLSTERLRHQERQWRTVLKPILGLLLAASEPLSIRSIRYILGVDDEDVRKGLQKLGGLVAEDGYGRRYLYHLRFRDYLVQSKDKPRREYVFASDEEEQWHYRLIAWCEQNGIEQIWSDVRWDAEEQERREYARKHYISHLYKARKWYCLWQVLDQGDYGHSKVRYGTSSYALDLDLGKQAAASEKGNLQQGIALLPNLWRYTLLRGSLTSRVDSYPESAFELLVLLGREREALGMAELLEDPVRRISAFLGIAGRLRKARADLRQESLQILLRSVQLTYAEEDIPQKFEVLRALGLELIQSGQLELALEIGQLVSVRTENCEVLLTLGRECVRTEQWERAQEVSLLIEDLAERFEIQRILYLAYIKNGNEVLAEAIMQQIKTDADWLDRLRVLTQDLLALGDWEHAKNIASGINWKAERNELLGDLAITLVHAGEWKRAKTLALDLEDWNVRFRVLRELGVAYAKAGEWKQCKIIVLMIEDKRERDEVLHILALALAQTEEWKRIESLLPLLEQKWMRVDVLSTLGGVLFRIGEWESADKIWKECESEIPHIQEQDRRARAWITLGKALADTRDSHLEQRAIAMWGSVEGTVRKIVKDSSRIRVWLELGKAFAERQLSRKSREQWVRAEAELFLSLHPFDLNREELAFELYQCFAENGEWERAIRLVSILKKHRQDALNYFCDLLSGLAEETKFEAIMRISLGMTEEYRKDEMLRDLCIALARKREWRYIKILLGSIISIELKVEALIALSEAGQVRLAGTFWTEFEANIRKREEERRAEDRTARALRGLARTLSEIKMWDLAEEVAHAIEQPEERADALQELAHALIRQQDWARAKAVSIAIEPVSLQNKALRNLVQALVQVHEWTQTGTIIGLIELPDLKVEALRFLAVALFQDQDKARAEELWNQVQQIILSFKDNAKRAELLSDSIAEWVALGRWTLLETICNAIEQDERPEVILRDLITALEQTREGDEIPESFWVLLQKAILSLQDAQQRVELLRDLSKVLIQAQQWTKILAAIRAIESVVERAYAYHNLCTALIKTQQFEVLKSILDEVEQTALLISGVTQRVEVLRKFGSVLVQVQQLEWAKKVWQKAEETIEELDDRRQRAGGLKDLGIAIAQAQQTEWAIDVWQKSEKIIKSLESSQQKDEILRVLGAALIQAQQWKWVETLAESIQSLGVKAVLLEDLINAMIIAFQWGGAVRVIEAMSESEMKFTLIGRLSTALAQTGQWKRAGAVVQMIQSRDKKITAILNLEVTLLQMRQWVGADAIYKLGRETINRLPQTWERAAALEDIAVAFARTQCWERAETVIKEIDGDEKKVHTLLVLGEELMKAREWKRADQVWRQTEVLVRSLDHWQEIDALQNLMIMLVRAQEWDRANALLTQIGLDKKKLSLQQKMGLGLIEAQEWERVEALIKILLPNFVYTVSMIENQLFLTNLESIFAPDVPYNEYVSLLLTLGKALGYAQRYELAKVLWDEVVRLAWRIEHSETRAKLLNDLADALSQVKDYTYLLTFVRNVWLQTNTRSNAVDLLSLAFGLVPLAPEIGSAFCKAFKWVYTFLKD